MGAATSINLVLNFVKGASMSQMISSIKNLQVIVHLVLMGVIVPANAQIYFSEIFKMIAFDPLDGIVDISGPVSDILFIKG